jgi:SagB-type dehydrogenase family enzyme
VIGAVHTYHDGTKHHFNRFARSLGYLDWASQPNPFRSFAGAAAYALYPRPDAAGAAIRNRDSALRPARASGRPVEGRHPASAIRNPVSAIRNPQSAMEIGDVLRHSLGLSAWKQFRESRWSLRVNPSSGNLHPTEAYLVAGPLAGVGDAPAVYHYAPDRHALEQRCSFDLGAWTTAMAGDEDAWLIALTSIHWREAWKYGERAFRYCQHDLGHAIAAVRIAAELVGRRARILPDWSHRDIAALVGIDRDEDYVDAEREEPGCVLVVASRQSSVVSQQPSVVGREALLEALRGGRWTGRANQLSEEHVQWTFIDEVAEATRDPGRAIGAIPPIPNQLPDYPITQLPDPSTHLPDRRLVLQRRSAVSFDGRGSIDAARCFAMLSAVMPREGAPWDALWWDARIHFVLFVHRVNGLDPGVYLLARHRSAPDRLRAVSGRQFLWEPAHESLPLFALARGDCRALAARVSCDQAIAGDGFFSLGMIADFDASLRAFGPSFYRHLFWESGVVGQVLYLEAEAAGARATGIGCFYDDPVHDVLGLTGHAFQSLYHFTIGTPVEDTRLTTAPGYGWESGI